MSGLRLVCIKHLGVYLLTRVRTGSDQAFDKFSRRQRILKITRVIASYASYRIRSFSAFTDFESITSAVVFPVIIGKTPKTRNPV